MFVLPCLVLMSGVRMGTEAACVCMCVLTCAAGETSRYRFLSADSSDMSPHDDMRQPSNCCSTN